MQSHCHAMPLPVWTLEDVLLNIANGGNPSRLLPALYKNFPDRDVLLAACMEFFKTQHFLEEAAEPSGDYKGLLQLIALLTTRRDPEYKTSYSKLRNMLHARLEKRMPALSVECDALLIAAIYLEDDGAIELLIKNGANPTRCFELPSLKHGMQRHYNAFSFALDVSTERYRTLMCMWTKHLRTEGYIERDVPGLINMLITFYNYPRDDWHAVAFPSLERMLSYLTFEEPVEENPCVSAVSSASEDRKIPHAFPVVPFPCSQLPPSISPLVLGARPVASSDSPDVFSLSSASSAVSPMHTTPRALLTILRNSEENKHALTQLEHIHSALNGVAMEDKVLCAAIGSLSAEKFMRVCHSMVEGMAQLTEKYPAAHAVFTERLNGVSATSSVRRTNISALIGELQQERDTASAPSTPRSV